MIITDAPRTRKRAQWNEGAVAVEAALTLSVLLLLMFGVIQFAVAFWQWNTMLLAVEEAGRYVMINKATCGSGCAQGRMQNVLTGAAVCASPAPGQTCIIATSNGGNPPTMTLTAQYNFNLTIVTGPLMLTSSTTVPLI